MVETFCAATGADGTARQCAARECKVLSGVGRRTIGLVKSRWESRSRYASGTAKYEEGDLGDPQLLLPGAGREAEVKAQNLMSSSARRRLDDGTWGATLHARD